MRPGRDPSPRSDAIDERLADLACLVDDSQPGWSREVLSEPYLESRQYVRSAMTAAGLEIRTDGAGNVIGCLRGTGSASGISLAPLVTGSHTDTVPGGGRFDGIVGVLGAIEAVEAMREANVALTRDLYVIDFLGEEANRFGNSCLGSRAVSGGFPVAHFDLEDPVGNSLGESLSKAGIDPNAFLASQWTPGSIHAYVELHIEQGPILEASGRDIGVVTGITGIERLTASFQGRIDHAGTAPMGQRYDALAAAAAAILAVERTACHAPHHGVGTTGRLESAPGVVNAVPGFARIWAELRSIDGAWLGTARQRLAERIAEEAASRGVTAAMEWVNEGSPVATTGQIQDVVAQAASGMGLTWEAVPSGAGHDAAFMAALGPMGMIFVPSVDGRSHCAEEFTPTTMILNGISTLIETLRRLDAQSTICV